MPSGCINGHSHPEGEPAESCFSKKDKHSNTPVAHHRPASCPICLGGLRSRTHVSELLPNRDVRTRKVEALPPVTAKTAETESHESSDTHVTTATRHRLWGACRLDRRKGRTAGKQCPACCHQRTQLLRRPPAPQCESRACGDESYPAAHGCAVPSTRSKNTRPRTFPFSPHAAASAPSKWGWPCPTAALPSGHGQAAWPTRGLPACPSLKLQPPAAPQGAHSKAFLCHL